MAEEVLIRPATKPDIPDLCGLADLLAQQHAGYDPARYRFPESVPHAYERLLQQEVGHRDAVVLVAEGSGNLIGYAYARVEPPCLVALLGHAGWIHDLYVLEEKRGRGIGTRLLDATIQALTDLKVTHILLGVAPQNEIATALYRRRGFRPSLQEMVLNHDRDTADPFHGHHRAGIRGLTDCL
jgi:ribosomal protein S18 acetylase RimI-like enzyme